MVEPSGRVEGYTDSSWKHYQPRVSPNAPDIVASLTGDRDMVLQAILNDPLTNNLENAKKMTDELIEANKKYLPLFFKKRGR